MGTIHYSAQPGTSDSALITAGSDMILTGIVASNATGSPATLSLSVHRSTSGQVETLTTALSVPATSAVFPVNMAQMTYGGVLLRSGDSLHGSASAASTIAVLAFE